MDDPTKQQLLGYLLGALDDAEREEVEQLLEANPHWQDELQSLMATLEPLAESYEEVDPPPGLAHRTCAVIAARCAKVVVRPASAWLQRNMQRDVRGGSRWTIADVVVAAGICLAAAFLFFPVIAQSRYQARRIACQKNLQELGVSLISYSEKAGQGYFPEVPIEGNRKFAGIYAPILAEAGYLVDNRVIVCPSSPLSAGREQWKMPTLDEIDEASGTKLIMIQRSAGGTYGYNLGVMVDGRHRAPKNQGRRHFALMGDAPRIMMNGYRSLNHEGRGQNILFEDGHVEYLVECQDGGHPDHPFQNRFGWMEAGIDVNDAVVAPSPTPPFAMMVAEARPIE
jgi:hypothetical protein